MSNQCSLFGMFQRGDWKGAIYCLVSIKPITLGGWNSIPVVNSLNSHNWTSRLQYNNVSRLYTIHRILQWKGVPLCKLA